MTKNEPPDFEDKAWNDKREKLTEALKAAAMALIHHAGGNVRSIELPLSGYFLTIEKTERRPH